MPLFAPLQPSAVPPGFMVLHGNRLEDLRDLLLQHLKAHPLGPLQPEVMLVQSNGMKQWLEMALADDAALGICAATRLELPSAFLWQAYRAVLGGGDVPEHMPFDKTSLVWRLVRMLPDLVAQSEVYQPLRRYLGGDAQGRRLYQLAVQLADVLDGYQSYRADWLADWAQGQPGQDALRTHDGHTQPLPAAHAWQACLWRDIRADVGVAGQGDLAESSRAAVHERFLHRLADQVKQGIRPVGLPPRIVVFGISSLPMQTVEALAALGDVCQVLMLVHNPCRFYWGDIVEGHDRLRQQVRRRQTPRPLGADASKATHPLLASWGKQGRDYLHLLDAFDQTERYAASFSRVDFFVDPLDDGTATRLRQIQSAMLNLEPASSLPAPREGDDSLVFVSAHSAQREVEVLHDRLLAWLDADPTLSPGDVMVMVPDMEAFAPHIQAVFGRFTQGQPRYVPHTLADTTARQSPLVQALEQLLHLPTARVSLADWLALFEVAAVRQRFGLTEADVAQLHEALQAAGVRWGLDAGHRRQWGMSPSVPGADQNTWAFGLRRLLLGYAVGAGDAWGDTLPQPGLGSLDARVFSALLDWVRAMQTMHDALAQSQSPAQWRDALHSLVATFFAPADAADERALQRLLEPLDAWQRLCQEATLETPLALDVVREHWLAQLDTSSLGQRFFGGGVQFGTLMPMRSIPFKVICLLGMNDGDYPRQQVPRDFDLMAQSWRAGDRSRREDDRYLFLEAMLSARQRLYISWQGRRATDNAEQPPSVLVAQLLDHLKTVWGSDEPVQQQPLQPFSRAYFVPDSPFTTYDDDWARVHDAQTAPAGAGKDATPAIEEPTSLSLDHLRRLLRQPVEVFFRDRLRVELDSLEDVEQEDEPFELDGLEKYQVGQQVLAASDVQQATSRLRLSGVLPMAAFGERLADEFCRSAEVVQRRRAPWVADYPHAVPPLAVGLAWDGITLGGSLSEFWTTQPHDPLHPLPPGTPLLQVQQRLAAVLEDKGRRAKGHILVGLWVNHLAACASGWCVTSVQLGLDAEVRFPPLPPDEARAHLQDLVQAWRQAWAEPLPVACKTGWAWVQAARAGEADPDSVAQGVFEGGYNKSSEWAESAYLQRVFEGWESVQAGLPPWAERLYGPMADALQMGAAA